MEYLRSNVSFGLYGTLAKRVVLGAPFYYRFIRGCFPNEKTIFPRDSRPVPILTEDPESTLSNTLEDYERYSTPESETYSSDEGQGDKDRSEMLLASTDLSPIQVGYDHTVRAAKAQWLDPWAQTPCSARASPSASSSSPEKEEFGPNGR